MKNSVKHDVIREGRFAEVGDLVREGWSYETRSIAPPYLYGVVIEAYPRTLKAYTAEQIAAGPVHSLKILCMNGELIRRYTVHVEVISESR